MSIIGKIVVVRDNRAGVFVGTLDAYDGPSKTATLTAARKIHYWQGAAAVEGLAVRGCRTDPQSVTRVTPAVGVVLVCDVVQVVEASPEGARILLDAPEWRP